MGFASVYGDGIRDSGGDKKRKVRSGDLHERVDVQSCRFSGFPPTCTHRCPRDPPTPKDRCSFHCTHVHMQTWKPEDIKFFRAAFLKCILATDLALSMEYTSKFQRFTANLLKDKTVAGGDAAGSSGGGLTRRTSSAKMVMKEGVQTQILLLQMVLKVLRLGAERGRGCLGSGGEGYLCDGRGNRLPLSEIAIFICLSRRQHRSSPLGRLPCWMWSIIVLVC